MKTTFLHLARALLAAALLPLVTTAAESPSLLLQKGIYAEEVERNLDSAIKIYEQIAAESAANRTVVAQAQYRLAVCYQKQGKKEQAIKLLNELAQQSPRDAAINKKARETLAEMGQTPFEDITIRRIPFSVAVKGIWGGSPNERFFAYTPKENGLDLAVYEIATGKTWTIVKGSGEKTPWSTVMFSPNSQWIAYDLSESSINISKTDGSGSRTLYERKLEKEELAILGWSPDGGQVIVSSVFKAAPEYRIFAIDTTSGATKEISRVANSENSGWWSLSSDGQYLARPRAQDPKGIALLQLKTGREETLVNGKDGESGFLVGWAVGDSKFLYAKARVGAIDLWSIKVNEGKASGEPELVWSNWGDVIPMGITPEGRIYFRSHGSTTDPVSLWVMEGFLARKVPAGRDPNATPGGTMPLYEIIGPNNSILDRTFGLSATLPAGWTFRVRRQNSGTHLIQLNIAPKIPDASNVVGINYRSTTPWEDLLSAYQSRGLKDLGPKPKSSAEIDAWLRNFAHAMEGERMEQNVTNYKNRVASVTSRTVNGHHALSWAADFTAAEKTQSEYFTVIFGENVIVRIWFQASTASIEGIRPALEQLIESIRLP